ncbi:MAG: polysaccharide export protein [Deltaproteobacteria bacterium]|nr:polysaccharide export protein [Deltaproteobacteria bacterium]
MMNARFRPNNIPSAMLPAGLPLRLLALFALLAVLPACFGDNPPVVYPVVAPLDENKLTLGPADKIELTIYYGSQERKAQYTIDPTGRMAIQYIGAVNAKDRTVAEVLSEITEKLKDGFLVDPIVSMSIVEINSKRVTVMGQVGRNGSIRFTPGMTITEAIAQSGGFAPLARKNMVKVVRIVEGKKETYKIPAEMIAEGKRPTFQMMPGDEVFVPERAW